MTERQNKKTISYFFLDTFFGISLFFLLIALIFVTAGMMRGAGFSQGLMTLGFLAVLVLSIAAKRPGLIFGFIGGFVVCIAAVLILIWSICGGAAFGSH